MPVIDPKLLEQLLQVATLRNTQAAELAAFDAETAQRRAALVAAGTERETKLLAELGIELAPPVSAAAPVSPAALVETRAPSGRHRPGSWDMKVLDALAQGPLRYQQLKALGIANASLFRVRKRLLESGEIKQVGALYYRNTPTGLHTSGTPARRRQTMADRILEQLGLSNQDMDTLSTALMTTPRVLAPVLAAMHKAGRVQVTSRAGRKIYSRNP